MVPPLDIISKTDGEFLIWGKGHVEIVDEEKDKISIEAVKKALPQLLKRHAVSYRFHKDIIVGEVVEKRVVDGKVYRTGVEGDTLWVLANIFDDNEVAKKTRREIEDGTLTSYSISGQALEHSPRVDEHGEVYSYITKMDLFAICVCEKGKNPEATFRILSKAEFLEKKVEKRGDKWCVIHCHGPETGQPIKCFDSKRDAEEMHAAIMANKATDASGFGGGTGEGPGGLCVCPECGYTEEHDKAEPCLERKCPRCGAEMARKESDGSEEEGVEKDGEDGRPPKEWWDQCIRTVTEQGSADDPAAVCGMIYYENKARKPVKSGEGLEKQHPTHPGEAWTGRKPTGKGRPPREWMDRCISKAQWADNPEGFCNALYFYGSESYAESLVGPRPVTQPGTSGGGVEVAKELPGVLEGLAKTLEDALAVWLGRARLR